MWILILVTTFVIGGAETPHKIAQFQSKEDCVEAMVRVHTGMVAAYPNELEFFRLECTLLDIKGL